MKKSLLNRPLSTLAAMLALTAAAFLSFGGAASAAPPTTICPHDEGTFCDLAISAPESVGAGQPFTVQVALGVVTFVGDTEVFTPLPPKDPCTSNVVVTLNIFITEGPPIATYTANASKGVATFNVAGLPASNFVELDASAMQTGGACDYNEAFTNMKVIALPVGQPIAPCPNDVSCTQTTSGSGSAATLFADTGDFVASFIPRVDNCGGGGPLDPNGVLSFIYSGNDAKTIIIALSPNLVTKGTTFAGNPVSAQPSTCRAATRPLRPASTSRIRARAIPRFLESRLCRVPRTAIRRFIRNDATRYALIDHRSTDSASSGARCSFGSRRSASAVAGQRRLKLARRRGRYEVSFALEKFEGFDRHARGIVVLVRQPKRFGKVHQRACLIVDRVV
jgi:hypothetical protein